MKRYKIIVSEPWDFKSSIGKNIILGNIVKVLSPLAIIFKSDHLLCFEKHTGKYLILKPRYEKQTFNQENHYEVTVGGGLLLTDDYENKDEEYLEINSKYFLIGSLKQENT